MSKKENNNANKWFEVTKPKVSETAKQLHDEFDNVFGDMLKEFNIKTFKEERKTI